MRLYIKKTYTMKKNYKNLIFTVLLATGMTFALASCNKDDDETTSNDQNTSEWSVKLSDDLLTNGIETDMKSAIIEVPVDCDGVWFATLNSDARWVRIEGWTGRYTGKQTLTLFIDENLTKVDRSTKLNITDSLGVVKHIDVKQYYNYEGQAPTNGNGLAFASKGMGTALDYDYALNVKKMSAQTSFEPTKIHGLNNILNMVQIEQLKKQGKLQQSAYVEASIPVAELKAKLLDSSLAQSKTIAVSFDLGIEFGPLTVTCHGDYSSKKKESRAIVDYTIVRNCPMYNAYVSPAELASFATDPKNNKNDYDADDAYFDAIDDYIARCKKVNQRQINRGIELVVGKDGLTADQALEVKNMENALPVRYDHACIFSTSFNDRYNQLYGAIIRAKTQGKQIDKNEVDAIVNAIDNEYGPFIIAGGDYGGLVTMHCDIDTTHLKGSATFKGEMTTEFAGYFNFEGSVTYTESGMSLLRNSKTIINIYGGPANRVTDQMFDIITNGKATDLNKWKGFLSGWIDDMKGGDDGTVRSDENAPAPISYVVTPVWTFFREPEIQKYVQDYFLEKYADRGIAGYFAIMNGEDKTGAEEIMNKDSDFWKKYSKN